jgi:hypothetical protein
MWDIRRNVDLCQFVEKNRYVVQFDFTGVPGKFSRWWLVINAPEVDVCLKGPGYEVNLCIKSHIESMTEICVGKFERSKAIREGLIQFTGLNRGVRFFPKWFMLLNGDGKSVQYA